jgi:hypothetical protein
VTLAATMEPAGLQGGQYLSIQMVTLVQIQVKQRSLLHDATTKNMEVTGQFTDGSIALCFIYWKWSKQNEYEQPATSAGTYHLNWNCNPAGKSQFSRPCTHL